MAWRSSCGHLRSPNRLQPHTSTEDLMWEVIHTNGWPHSERNVTLSNRGLFGGRGYCYYRGFFFTEGPPHLCMTAKPLTPSTATSEYGHECNCPPWKPSLFQDMTLNHCNPNIYSFQTPWQYLFRSFLGTGKVKVKWAKQRTYLSSHSKCSSPVVKCFFCTPFLVYPTGLIS